MKKLTHFDEEGRARMVDVGGKGITRREAVAWGCIKMNRETFRRIQDKEIEKGDPLEVAQVAGIMAAKKTSELIPMCHPLSLTSVELSFETRVKDCSIGIRSKVKATERTGVEMEALTAVAAAALTIYDMCKSSDRGMVISEIKLLEKRGGKSGRFIRT